MTEIGPGGAVLSQAELPGALGKQTAPLAAVLVHSVRATWAASCGPPVRRREWNW